MFGCLRYTHTTYIAYKPPKHNSIKTFNRKRCKNMLLNYLHIGFTWLFVHFSSVYPHNDVRCWMLVVTLHSLQQIMLCKKGTLLGIDLCNVFEGLTWENHQTTFDLGKKRQRLKKNLQKRKWINFKVNAIKILLQLFYLRCLRLRLAFRWNVYWWI